MIRQLQITNFRCLRSVTLDLEPLTVFVGANASGKSSVFAALQAARSRSFSESDRWGRNASLAISVEAHEASHKDRSGVRYQGINYSTEHVLPESLTLQLDVEQLRALNVLQETRRLERNGFGLANLFDTLTREQQSEVAREFCKLVPMFADVNRRPSHNGQHRFLFQDRWHAGVEYEPQQVSDGSILMLAYLLVGYQSPPPDVLCIEEPERGLHPYLMGELVSTLRKLAKGELGPKPVQVLLATHSAELLEFVEPKEVRFFRRTKDTGETVVEKAPLDDPSWLNTLKTYDQSLGDLWLSGGLGGVPGR
jgi:predicted ATPase